LKRKDPHRKGQVKPKPSCSPSIPIATLVQAMIQFHVFSVPNEQNGK